MRRITAVAAAVVAAASTLVITGPAQAATPVVGNAGPGTGGQTGPLSTEGIAAKAATSAPPIKPGARKHYFTVPSVTGAKIRGDWYWAKSNGPYKIVTQFYITDTRRDRRAAALSLHWKYHGKAWVLWVQNTHGAGTTLYTWGAWVPGVKPLNAASMVGVARANPHNPKQRTFYYDRRSRFIHLTW